MASIMDRIIGGARETQSQRDKLWNVFFPKKEWLSVAAEMGLKPTLVGFDVKKAYNGVFEKAYIALVAGDYSGDLVEKKELLLECLNINNGERTFDAKTNEVYLKELNITLNIEDVYVSNESVKIDPTKLISNNSEDEISSAALFWGDDKLRTIGPDAIVGLGGRATKLESVASICGIELTHPESSTGRWNQMFVKPDFGLEVKPIKVVDRFVEGWELVK